ncbi:tetratricopeptide repeat protein [Streptomyces sp. DSM 44915]|uniref:Tetratricopeptide repeat protein n=1 Tax=Streptomyces chisholmiae TaxID=3075540 RepID=A0ABU2JSQ9_9ACTN|nr:tetratricopeptide repeat protein [Streptomyces sp. DSM 44915]MDT0268017.1 tetratricopeptide repeat protein [Streptomyces sp. DSM 44915]
MGFRIQLLGTVELHAGEESLPLGSPQGGLVLAALAWDVGQMVSLGTLIDRVWDTPPRQARSNLHVHIARIRDAFRRVPGPDAPTIVTRAHTYTLRVPPPTVDVHRYLDLTAQARGLADHGELAAARQRLGEADGLWCGEPLAGLDSTWAGQIRETLTQRQLYLALTRASIALRLRRPEDAIDELLPLTRRHPVDESLAEHLALAYYGAGRSRDADLEVERVRHELRLALGSGLGIRLRRFRQAVADQTPADEVLTAAGFPATRPGATSTSATRPGAAHSGPAHSGSPGRPDRRHTALDNLPPDVNWVGREAELTEITTAVRERGQRVRAVVIEGIDGMPGVGKTSMALHIAHRLKEDYPDARLIVNLHGHDRTRRPLDTVHTLTDLLRRFDYPDAALPRDEEALITAWRSIMAERRALLILDDAASPEQVRPLLPGASSSLVIVTSRHRLAALPGARSLSLDVLPESEAVALFRSRLRGRRTATTEEVARVVRLCGHLPLAIDIVAVRFLTRPSWRMSDLAAQLTSGKGVLREMRDGSREVTPAFDMSYRALEPLERGIFRHIGLMPGPEFGSRAVAALTGISRESAERGLENLLYVHLITEPSSHRYSTHDLLREFAQVLVRTEQEAAESAAALDRLADAYITAADLADRAAYPHRSRFVITTPAPPEVRDWVDEAQPLRWFLTEKDSLLPLFEQLGASGDRDRSARLAHALAGFLGAEGYLGTAGAQLRDAVAYWREHDEPRAEACAHLDLLTVAVHRGELDESVDAATRALEIAERLDDPGLRMEAMQQLGRVNLIAGRIEATVPLLRRLVELGERHSNRRQLARARNALGTAMMDLGEHQEAMRYFQGAYSDFKALGDPRGQYVVLSNSGELSLKSGDAKNSVRLFRKALEAFPATGPRHEKVAIQMNLAETLFHLGDSSSALTLYREALHVFTTLGHKKSASATMNSMGRALQSLNRYEEAVSQHQEAVALASEVGAEAELGRALAGLGEAEHGAGRLLDAAGHLQRSLEIVRRLKLATDQIATLRGLAALRASQGLHATSAALQHEADTLAGRLDAAAPDLDSPQSDDV